MRGLSGVLAAGMVALVVGLVVAWVVGAAGGLPGPGAATLARARRRGGRGGASAQVCADRTAGPRGALAAAGVIVTVGAVLTVEWLV